MREKKIQQTLRYNKQVDTNLTFLEITCKKNERTSGTEFTERDRKLCAFAEANNIEIPQLV